MRRYDFPMMKRREFVKMLAAAPFAAMGANARAAAPGNRLLILVYLYGGNDGYNTWVPYADPLYYKLRPTIAVPRDGVLKITDRHGFHPSLAPLMPVWEARELALVQGIGLPDITQQHFRDSEMAFTACDSGEYPIQGWAARAIARLPAADGALANAVAFNTLDIRESDPMGPFRGSSRPVVQLHWAEEWLAKRRVADCVTDMNAAAKARPAREEKPMGPVALKTEFPTDPFGNAMRAVVEMASLDRAIPVFHVALNGLDGDKHHSVDCHWKQNDFHGDALARLAKGLASLRAGMIEIGRWDETLVASYDEFGRSPVENVDRGTHHGAATTHFVLGGRVKGGLLGEAPPVIRVFNVGGPAAVVDTRRLWTTVVENWWQTSAEGIFTRRHAPLDLLRA
jgi:uncharacterized protein (DUF1501 family)